MCRIKRRELMPMIAAMALMSCLSCSSAFTSTTHPSPFSLRSKTKTVLSASVSSSVEKQQSLRVHKNDNPADIGRRITHLGKIGRTDDALSLYYSLFDIRTNNYNPQSNNNNSRNGRRKKTIGPTTRFMNCAIDACARARPPRLQQAQDIFHHGVVTHGLSPNVFTFGSLISACARARDATKALELLNAMQEQYSIRPNAVVYSTAISACERTLPHPHYRMALKLLQQAIQDPTVQMTVVGYNTAISALARAGQWKMAVQLLDEMEQDNNSTVSGQIIIDESKLLLPTNIIKPKPDQITYGTVMAACERSYEWKEVLRFANKMQSLSPTIQMDGIALTSALHACQQLGYADEAIYYLNLMKQLSNNDTDDENNNSKNSTNGRQRKGAKKPLQGPDEVAYHLAISACARSNEENRYLEGIRLLEEEMPLWNLKPDVVAYTAAIAGCADAGDWKKAVQLLIKMKEEDSDMPNVVTYSAVIGACATATAKAAKINDENSSVDQDDSPYVWDYEDDDSNTKVSGSSKNAYDIAVQKPLEKAMQLLSYMKTPQCNVEPNIVTYNAAIRACAEGHDLLGAFRLLDELIERGLQPTIVTYGSLMTACERVGSVEAASDVFKRMRKTVGSNRKSEEAENEEMKPNEIIYGAAISCCRKARQPDRAFLLLRRMLKDGLSPNAATFNTVILAATEGKKPNLDQAILVYRLMKSKKLLSSSSTSSPPLTSIVGETATETSSSESLTTAPVFCKPNRQTYNILIQALSSNRRPEEAELFLRKMRLDGYVPDVDLFTSTVQAYEQNGQPMKALRLMENMREDGYDFYEVKVLNEAFKKAVKLVNVVGRGFSSSSRNATSTATPTDSDANGEEIG